MSGWRTDEWPRSPTRSLTQTAEAGVMARLRSLSDVDAALAFWLLLSASALSSEPYRQATAEEITVRLVGQEFTDYVHSAHVFEKDGRLTSFSVGKQGSGM